MLNNTYYLFIFSTSGDLVIGTYWHQYLKKKLTKTINALKVSTEVNWFHVTCTMNDLQ